MDIENFQSYSIPRRRAEEILKEAMSVSESVLVDMLDCSSFLARKPTNKTVDEVFQIGLEDRATAYHFIYREGEILGGSAYFDVGLSTMGHQPAHFLWIRLSVDAGLRLIKKFKLRKL